MEIKIDDNAIKVVTNGIKTYANSIVMNNASELMSNADFVTDMEAATEGIGRDIHNYFTNLITQYSTELNPNWKQDKNGIWSLESENKKMVSTITKLSNGMYTSITKDTRAPEGHPGIQDQPTPSISAAKYKAQKSQEWLDMVAEMPKINFDVDNEPTNKSK